MYGGNVASNDAASDVRSGVSEFDRSSEKTVGASQVLEEIGGGNRCSTSSINSNGSNGSSAWVLVWVRVSVFVEFLKRVEFITSNCAVSSITDGSSLSDDGSGISYG